MPVLAQHNAEPRYRHDDARQNGAPARIDEILAEESGAGLALHHGIVHCSPVWINGLAYGSLSLSIRLLAAAGEHASCGHAYSTEPGRGDDSGGPRGARHRLACRSPL